MKRAVLMLWLPAVGALVAAGWTRGAEMPTDKSIVNSLGIRLVRIQPGSFLMGTAEGGDFDERPVHRVTISGAFYLGATEVTNAQYEQFDPAHRKLRGKLGMSTVDDEAVIFVSWLDADRFCRWLAAKEMLPYRLPTEAEWEHACRAGTTTAYHTGEELADPAFKNNVGISWFPDPAHPQKEPVRLLVGRTPANPWGLFDVHGNVEEWCLDWYGPYAAGDQADPPRLADVAGNDADLRRAWGDQAGAIGSNDGRARAPRPGFELHGIAHRDMLGDDHDEPQPGVYGFQDSLSGAGRRDKDHRGIGPLLLHGVCHGVIHRQAFHHLTASAGRHPCHQRRARLQHPMGLGPADFARDCLDNCAR